MNKILTLVDKGVNKGYFRWLWIIGVTSCWAFMVFAFIFSFRQNETLNIYIMYDEKGNILERHESVDIVASVIGALHPDMIALCAFMILTPFLVKWIGQWIYKAVRKKEEKIK